MPDPIFNFTLRPLEDVEPWGKPPHVNLHWFGLTDGHYWLRLGDQTLYEHSPEILRHWNLDPAADRYVDYQVSRLHEDVASFLGVVLEPVPDDIAAHTDALLSLRLTTFCPDDCYPAIEWLYDRCLPAMHLAAGPSIHFVRTADRVRILWDNRHLTLDGHPVWTSERGDVTLPVDRLLTEFRDFHDRLMTDMARRVDLAPDVMARRGIELHVATLDQEQAERSPFPPRPLTPTSPTDWPAVREAIRKALGA